MTIKITDNQSAILARVELLVKLLTRGST